MKNINCLILIIAFVSLFIACKKENNTFESKLMIGNAYLEVSNKSQRYTFDVLSNQNIEVSTDASWITLDSANFEKGKNKVGFTALTNEDDERSGIILVKMGAENEREVLVVQETGKAPVFYVKPDGTGDGKSWANATDLNTALEKSTTNSIIYLAEGIYKPSKTIRNGDATNEADKTFEIAKNVTLIGGYESNPTSGSTANPAIYKTIFDGQLSASVNSYHTVTITAAFDAESKVSISGVIIKGGNATNRGSNVTIADVRYNRGWGGGMLIANAKVELNDVEVVDNKTSNSGGTVGYGAGIYAFNNADITFRNVKINDNKGGNNGGGMWLADGNLTAYNSQFNNNSASGTAAGLHGYPNATLTLYNCEIKNNSNTSYGAGLYVRENSKAYVINSIISGNKSTSSNGGGGVMLYGGNTVYLISSTVVDNTSAGPGGGVYRRNLVNNLEIYNSVVAGNIQTSTSKDIDNFVEATATNPTIRNSVIMTSVYSDQGTIEAGYSFVPSAMLNSDFMPIGQNNPALVKGVDKEGLSAYASTFNPIFSDHITKDMFGAERQLKIMGYKVK
jgi:hypothetical protein